jgi:hypothetical protein
MKFYISLLIWAALLSTGSLGYETNSPPYAPTTSWLPTNAVILSSIPPAPYPIAQLTSDLGTPGPSRTFDGFQGAAAPPDTQGAVGPNHVVTMDNNGVFIFNRSGTNLFSTNNLTAWWENGIGTNAISGHFAFDPRVIYDPYADRWMATACYGLLFTNSELLVAVSAGSDPTLQWYFRTIRVDSSGTLAGDFPQMGFNKNWIAVSALMLGTDASGPKQQNIYCFDRTNFYANGSTRTDFAITTLSNNFWICPAVTLDPNEETLYFVQRWAHRATNLLGNVRGYLRVHTITGTPASPTFTSTTRFPEHDPWDSKDEDDPSPNFLPQAGTTNKIDVGTDVIGNVVYRNGYLWAAHTILLPADNPTRSAIQWWGIPATGGNPIVGRLDDSGGTNFFAYPSIAVNRANDVMVGFSVFSSNSYPSAAYAFRGGSDKFDALRSPYQIYGAGQDTYIRFSDIRNRWGDYSATVVDPANDFDFWTLQEYALAPTNSVSGLHGVKWAYVVVEKPANDNFTNAFDISGSSGSTNGSGLASKKRT